MIYIILEGQFNGLELDVIGGGAGQRKGIGNKRRKEARLLSEKVSLRLRLQRRCLAFHLPQEPR